MLRSSSSASVGSGAEKSGKSSQGSESVSKLYESCPQAPAVEKVVDESSWTAANVSPGWYFVGG